MQGTDIGCLDMFNQEVEVLLINYIKRLRCIVIMRIIRRVIRFIIIGRIIVRYITIRYIMIEQITIIG